jgi:hypothetical protein
MTSQVNNPVIDPTANVLKLVEGEVKRLNDLRDMQIDYDKRLDEMQSKWMDSKDAAQALQNKTFESRIAEVERVQYEGKGKTGVTDPMMLQLFTKLDDLIKSQSAHTGEDSGKKYLWGWIFGAVMTVIAVITLITTFIK